MSEVTAIPNGHHKSVSVKVEPFTTDYGQPAVMFTWQLAGYESQPIGVAMCPVTREGTKNRIAIPTVCKWTGWDGLDLNWLIEHQGEFPPAMVQTLDGKVMWYSKWIEEQENTLKSMEPRAQKPESTIQLPRYRAHPEKLASLPEDIPGTVDAALAVRDILIECDDPLDADKIWVILAARIGARQTRFTEENWLTMIDYFKKMASAKKEQQGA